MSIVGQNIKRIRAKTGMTQKELAEKAGVAPSLIGTLETDKVATTKKLPQIARALDVHPADIDPAYGEAVIDPDSTNPISSQTPARPLGRSLGSIPLLTEESIQAAGLFKRTPAIGSAPLIDVIADASAAYALMIASEQMIPELDPGDCIYVNPVLPLIKNTTCLIFCGHKLDAHIVARIEGVNSKTLHVAIWNAEDGAVKRELSREEWPVAHRIVGKIYRS